MKNSNQWLSWLPTWFPLSSHPEPEMANEDGNIKLWQGRLGFWRWTQQAEGA